MVKDVAQAVLPAGAWQKLSAARWHAADWIARAGEDSGTLGVPAAVTLAATHCATRAGGAAPDHRPLYPLAVRGYRHPLYYREGSSDPDVIRQVFGKLEYAAVADADLRTVLDLGANIGCAASFMLHRCPAARVVVVEPDADNLRVCRRTLAPFADRVTFVHAGVWPTRADLVVDRGRFGDGREWSFQVRPARPGERAGVRGLTVPDLLEIGGFDTVDLLKIDIEGTEQILFGPGSDGWLARTRTLAVELHGPGCERAAAAAVGRFPHAVGRSGELTVYRFAGRPKAGAPR